MSETDPCGVGVQSCGCITFVDAAPERMDREGERTLLEIVRRGGNVIHTTVGEAREMPDFLPTGGCPHDPKGWDYK